MLEDRVNGDQVTIVDPLDHEKSITLNGLYMRLSNEQKLQYPAPFQEVDIISDHVQIAEELYLGLGDYFKYREAKRQHANYDTDTWKSYVSLKQIVELRDKVIHKMFLRDDLKDRKFE